MSNFKVGTIFVSIVVMLMAGAAFVTWAVTAEHYQEARLKYSLAPPKQAWIDKYGDSIDSYQAFSIASIINEMQNAKAKE